LKKKVYVLTDDTFPIIQGRHGKEIPPMNLLMAKHIDKTTIHKTFLTPLIQRLLFPRIKGVVDMVHPKTLDRRLA
jgi:hypothetical protein